VNSGEPLAIGDLAGATGVTISALRYYDEVGLISPCSRVGGKRRFSPETVGRVNFVRRAQKVGFSLDEIRDILDDTAGTWNEVVAQKLDALRSQQTELTAMIGVLEEVMACGCRIVADCPRRLPEPA
jgi:DNA-binding transcriptional MerR regulator